MIAGVSITTCTLDDLVANAPLVLRCVAPEDTPMSTDWFSAVGTVGATIVAIVIGFISILLTRREHAANEKIQLRNQAERVAAWLEVETSDIVPDAITESSCKVVVQNASDQPVWDVMVSHWSLGTSGHWFIPLLAPMATKEKLAEPIPGGDGVSMEEAVQINFRDNAGRDWQRSPINAGRLRLLRDETFEDAAHTRPPTPPKARFLDIANKARQRTPEA